MPKYGKRKYSIRRKTYRKRNYKRRRFSKKRFSRSPVSLRTGLYIPKQAYVKMPFTQIIQSPALTSGANYNLAIWGTGITCPLGTNTNGVPANGDIFPLGLEEYSTFYQYYKVLGASCTVQINSSTTISGDSTATSQASYFCSLTSAQGTPYDSDTDSNYYKMVNTTTENLISYPTTSWKLMSLTTGSRQNIYLKRFGKTKSIIGVKDVRDIDNLQGLLPNTDTGAPNGRNPASLSSSDNDQNWFFLLRIDPNLAVNIPVNSFQIILKMKYYVQLYGRDFNNQGIAIV